MSDLGRIVVLAGGLSHERDVSLRSGRRAAEALRALGETVDVLDADPDLLRALREDPPAAVLPTLHGSTGEDGAIRDVLELLGLPYVGSRPRACRLAFDKPNAKTVVGTAGVATPPSLTLSQSAFTDLGAPALMDLIVARLGLPLFCKPARGGSALGASRVEHADQLPEAMVACFAYGDTVLLEPFLSGTELAVSVLDTGTGPRALPAVEIVPEAEIYDYAARYTAGMTEFFTPARLSPEVAAAVADTAVRAHRALGLRDLSRTDLIVDADGVPWFLEVNVAPGLTETSLLPLAADEAGLDLGAVYRDLLAEAVRRCA